MVVTLNHLGSILGFAAAELALSGGPRPGLSPSGPVKLVQPVISTTFADDLERTVAVGARLVSSRPASAPDGGLLVSEPVHRAFGKPALDAEVALEGWGRVTALCTFGTGREQLVAVGGEGRATLVALDDGRFGRKWFEVDLPLRAARPRLGRPTAVGCRQRAHGVTGRRLPVGRPARRPLRRPRCLERPDRRRRPPARRGGVGQRWRGGGDGRRPALRGGEDRAPALAG